MVVHHDHMLNFIHDGLLEALSPRNSDHPHSRPDHGKGFSDFVRSHRKDILERIAKAKTPLGIPIIRFEPTDLCERLNAKDGNGKLKGAEARRKEETVIKYWSMTPAELQECAINKRTWDEIYDADHGKIDRHNLAVGLVDILLAEHRSQMNKT